MWCGGGVKLPVTVMLLRNFSRRFVVYLIAPNFTTVHLALFLLLLMFCVCVLVLHSILSCLLQIWSLIVVLLSKKYKQLPHMITTNLLVAQVSSKKIYIFFFFACVLFLTLLQFGFCCVSLSPYKVRRGI